MKAFYEFMAKDFPEGNKLDQGTVVGYGVAQTLVSAEAMRRQPHPRECHEAGGEPEGLPHRGHAARHQDQHQPHRFRPDQPLQLMRFQGERWNLFGDVISGQVGG